MKLNQIKKGMSVLTGPKCIQFLSYKVQNQVIMFDCLHLIILNNIITVLEVVLVTLFAHIFPDENTALKL